jgi:LysM repeat protein
MRARAMIVPIIAVALLLAIPGLAGGRPSHPVAAARVHYTVQAGDTLWAIAKRVAPARDPRAVVDQVARENHLQGPLQAGQELLLPAPGGPGGQP